MNSTTPTESAEYQKLSALAREIEDKLSSLVVATAQAGIPDAVKCNVLDWIKRTETFNGLSYFLTPQTEWLGGDSRDAKNFAVRAPHIANINR